MSPDHALFVEGKLIPARLLVNGASIVVETECRSVVYYHVELDRHDILLAEGLPAESYLDTGNRAMFANGGQPPHLHADFAGGQQARQTMSCAPFVSDATQVEPVWRTIASRAESLGWTLPERSLIGDPDLHVLAGTRRLQPVAMQDGRYTFLIPAGGQSVWLKSRAARPCDDRPWIEDRRRLGVMVRQLRLHQDQTVSDIAVAHPTLEDGWWAIEWDDSHWPCRWTNGAALLPIVDPGLLEVELTGSMRYPHGDREGGVGNAARYRLTEREALLNGRTFA